MSTGKISSLLTRVQNFWQYLLFGWFLAASLLIALGGSLAESLARIGVLLILAAIVTVLVTLAEQFRRQRKRNWAWMCYLLIAILAATAATKFLVP
jgi:uncharacterized membrane protein HdeD (DUF308 family)